MSRASGNGMPASNSYRDLEAWQVAMTVVQRLYTVTSRFPGEERFRLTAQLRRAAVSMPSNVAEGWGDAPFEHTRTT